MVNLLKGNKTVNPSIAPGEIASKPIEVTKHSPCPHCGKPDWCYSIGELTVCNRDAEPATGWERTSKTDRNGKPYYAPATAKKSPRPQGKEEYVYTDTESNPLIKVTIIRPGKTKDKDVFQEYWDGTRWTKAKDFSPEQKRSHQQQITIYRYAEVREAIAAGKPVFVVEGERLADSLWARDIAATTNIGGAGKYRSYGNYQSALENANLVLCPDRDEPGLKHMEDINEDFPDAKWLYAPPSDFYWTHLPKHGGLDIQDWIDDGATAEDILQAIEDRRIVVDALNKTLELEADRDRPTESKLEQKLNAIRAVWGGRLRWNTLKKQVELDGQRLPLDRIDLKVAIHIHIDISKEQAKSVVLELALANPYNPVVEYLESVEGRYPNVDVNFLDKLAERYFGTNDPLHAALMKRTLIAAVARAFEPGCKHDEITILQGKQKSLKSTFWEILAGEEFFTDDLNGTEKDEILKISQYWILEYAEFENAYKKKDVSQLKAFLSRKKDSMRRPYGTDIEDFPRPSILVGTTNLDEFLYDPTGERRFWVIKVLFKKIPIHLLEQERDLIWATAVAAYRNGEQWRLTDTEDEWLDAANKQYQSTDTWEEAVMAWAELHKEVSVGEILSDVLKIELAKQSKAEQNRVAAILRSHGWTRGDRKRVNGRLIRPWIRPQQEVEQEVERGVEQEVEHPQPLVKHDLQPECSTCSTNSPQTFPNFESNNETTPETLLEVTPQEIEPLEIEPLEIEPLEKNEKSLEGQGVEQLVDEPQTQSPQVIEECSTPRSTPCSTSLFVDQTQAVVVNALLIRECIADQSWELMEALLEEWTDEFKAAVWQELTPEERKAVKQLKPKA
ncbi:VapE domain-containing protein [Anabaena sp. UHCC 0399]|uniref:VapE domain-containing protein n=1 Tax=Anabaena sp. UHCC 0399 TaxID=3110238 RepID=UPI002B1FA25C|nr:VapE domain-containing protein [Anabaena sp. UHCC 0399]MEA5569129.1 VapE domain-containing protein [Anabaena sp. UHCC 0399]